MRFIIAAALPLAWCVVAADVRAQSSNPVAPDVIMVGGKIFTADNAHPWAQALAVRGDRIVAVGSTRTVRALAAASTRVIELAGRLVIPGINDAHDHMGYAAPTGVEIHAGIASHGDPSLREVLDSLRSLSARTTQGVWLTGDIGRRVLDDSAATRRVLDGVAPNNPVKLATPTGHTVLLNTPALRAFGIPEDAQDQLGGWYERDGSGRLTGMLQEYVLWGASRHFVSALPESVLVAAVREYARVGFQYGITSVQDMANDFDPALTIRLVRQVQPAFRLRIIKFSIPDRESRRAAEWDSFDAHPSPLAVVSGRKWILEGTGVERNSLRRTPYPGRGTWRGRMDFSADTIRAILREALSSLDQLMLHVGADSAISLVLTIMHSLAADSVWRPLRVRFEHGDALGADFQPAAKRMGVVVVQNPTHFGNQPLRSIARAGIPIAIGSDGARNPYLNIMLAARRPENPGEALTREAAVTAYTRGSAYAEFAEQEQGTIAPGMLADLAVLSQDIFTVPLEKLPSTVSLLTMVGGRIAYETPPRMR